MVLTQEEGAELQRRAMYVSECMAAPMPSSAHGTNPQFDTWWHLWANLFPSERDFHYRLGLDGWNPREAAHRLRTPLRALPCPPQWVGIIQQVIASLPICVEEVREASYLTPWILVAGRCLEDVMEQASDIASRSMFRGVLDGLARDLDRVCGTTLRAIVVDSATVQTASDRSGPNRADGWRAVWRDFGRRLCEGYWKEVILQYPVMARLMATLTLEWCSRTRVLVSRLRADLDDVNAQWFNNKGLGRANSLRRGSLLEVPCVVEFESTDCIAYLDRSPAAEVMLNELTEWLIRGGLDLHLCTPRVLDRKTYGWMESFTAEPLTSLEQAPGYYSRAGMLLALVYASEGYVRPGELLAFRDRPVLTAWHPLTAGKAFTDDGAVYPLPSDGDEFARSVLGTGLLPTWFVDEDSILKDRGCLTSDVLESDLGIPRFGETTVNIADYLQDLVAGFADAYGLLMAGAAEWTRWLEGRSRYLHKEAAVYGLMLQALAQPRFLADGITFSLKLESLLLSSSPDGSNRSELARRWPVFLAERAELEQFRIPMLDVESQQRLCMTPLRSMSGADHRFQAGLIQAVVAERNVTPSVSGDGAAAADLTANATDVAELLDEAARIADFVANCAIAALKGDSIWLGKHFNRGVQAFTPGPLDINWYHGASGIALFLARVLASCPGSTRLTSVVHRVMETNASAIKRIPSEITVRLPTGWIGIGGWIKATLGVSAALGEDYVDCAVALASAYATYGDVDSASDILSGEAGLIISLLDLADITGEGRWVELAHRYGKHLLSRRVHIGDYAVWQALPDAAPLAGFAHGAAGYTYTMGRLYAKTGESAYLEAVEHGLGYEDQLFDATVGNWQDLRPSNTSEAGPRFMTGWCNGAAGIGLSRLRLLALVQPWEGLSRLAYRDVDRALAACLAAEMGPVDILCCGEASRVDLVLEAGVALQKPSFVSLARSRLHLMKEKAHARGGYALPHGRPSALSLMQGIAGIGDQMLRAYSPSTVGSLLT